MSEAVRILAVDDSVTIRKALELILVPAGFAVEFAVNGAEAIDKAKSLRPRIVLLDFILPDMRGTEVCRVLLADASTRDIPVILISARGAEIRQAYHDVDNVVDYLTKPFTPAAVLGVLSEVLSAPTPPVASLPVDAGEAAGEDPRARANAAADAAPADDGAVSASADIPGLGPSAGDGTRPERDVSPAPAVAGRPPRPREAEAPEAAAGKQRPAHDVLEAMFEMLRGGLEGIYVEEVDSPAALGERNDSFTQLASQLARQLGETMEQAESRQRFRLYGDGSVRSLDESLLEAYRRLCRLLFRAVGAGAISAGALERDRPRVLVVCPRESDLRQHLEALTARSPEAHFFAVTGGFRQLSMLVRLVGPSHLVADPGRGTAVLDQLRNLRRLPESKRLEVALICRAEDAARFADVGADCFIEGGDGVIEKVRRWLSLSPEAPARSEAAAGAVSAPLAVAQ